MQHEELTGHSLPRNERDHNRHSNLIHALDALSTTMERIFIHVTGRENPSLQDISDIVTALRHVAAAPNSAKTALMHPDWVNNLSTINSAIAIGQRFSELLLEINSHFRSEAWNYDTTPLLALMHTVRPTFFWRLTKRHRQGVANLSRLLKHRIPKEHEDRIKLIEKLKTAQATRQLFIEQGAFLASVLGPIWNEFETNWDEALSLSKWTHVALSLLGGQRLVEMAARSNNLEVIRSYADHVDGLLHQVTTGLVDTAQNSSSGRTPAEMEINRKMPLRELRHLLTK